MESAFAWLQQLSDFVIRLFPHLLIIETTHRGVAFKRGSHVKILGPGLHWWWPIWTSTYVHPVKRQTQKLPEQALTTKDGKAVVVGGMIRFVIDDIQQAWTECWNIDAVIVDEALGVFSEFITTHTFEEIQTDRHKANTRLTRQVRAGLRKFGVHVIRGRLTDFCTAITLNHSGSGMTKHLGEA